jgi:RNA 3'-terminal phosphate cyclase (ATP)
MSPQWRPRARSVAACEGLTVGSSDVTFRPGNVAAGVYHFAVGTAGSTGLVLQTVLMPLAMADAPSRLVLEGGTHNMAFEFIANSFLPVINWMGPAVTARLVRPGFYPRGGGGSKWISFPRLYVRSSASSAVRSSTAWRWQ